MIKISDVTTDMCHIAKELQQSLLADQLFYIYLLTILYYIYHFVFVSMVCVLYIQMTKHTAQVQKLFPTYVHTFPEPLSGLVPGVPVFCSKDTHRVLTGSGGSPQDTVELLHYVTTRGCSQTTTWDFIQNVQLKELPWMGGRG